jgi:type II secretory pathway pseudopilin PulG
MAAGFPGVLLGTPIYSKAMSWIEATGMMKSKRAVRTVRKDRTMPGFTVLEVLVATVILLVGIIGVSQMVPQALDYDMRNRDTSSSIMAAQRELEQMIKLPIDVNQLATGTDYSFTDADGFATYLGALPNPATAAATAAPPPPAQSGCPLTATGAIDFSQPCLAAGYTKVFSPPLGSPFENYDLRWNVITYYGNDNGTIKPILKRIAIAGRSTDGSLTIPATLNVMVAP